MLPIENLQHELNHTARLLANYHPDWQVVLGPPTAAETDNLARLHMEPIREADRLTLRLVADAPRGFLARRACGMGIPDPDFPDSLWAIQVAMAQAFHLRVFGWTIRLGWPAHFRLGGEPLGGVTTRASAHRIAVESRIALAGRDSLETPAFDGPFPIAPLQIVCSLSQCVLMVMESPWPRRVITRHYREWCETVGTTMAPADGRDAGEGIAIGIDAVGRLVLKMTDGRRTTIDA